MQISSTLLVILLVSTILTLVIALAAFWIWALVDCAKRKFKEDTEKIVETVIIAVTWLLGALIYYIAIKLYNPKGLSK